MYAIVWGEAKRVCVVAAGMEGKRLAMTVYKSRRGTSNRIQRTCRIFCDFCDHVMSKGQYSFEAQCSLPCLTTLTAASANQADQSMLDQSSSYTMAPNHLWGDWAKAPLLAPLQGMYKL